MIFSFVNFVNLSIAVETIFCANFLAWRFPRRPHYFWRLLGGSLAVLLIAYFLPLVRMNMTVDILYAIFMYVLILALCTASLFLSYDTKASNLVFCGLCGYAIRHLAGCINDLTFGLLADHFIQDKLVQRSVRYLCCYALIALALFLLYRYLLKDRRNRILLDDRHTDFVAVIILLFNICLSSTYMIFNVYDFREGIGVVFDLYNMSSSAMVVFFAFFIVRQYRIQEELRTFQVMLNEQSKQYRLSKSNIEQINIKCHDLKYRLQALASSNSAIDQKEIGELKENISIYDSVVRTNNPALDVILTEKSLYCRKHGITFTYIVDGKLLSFLDEVDAYCLLGNAVSNAVEAVMKIKDRKRRNISLTIRRVGEMTSVHIENCYAGEIRMQNGRILTSKGDADNHGFGIRSIQMIAEKYGGILSIKTYQNIFSLEILFPSKPSSLATYAS